MNDPRMERARGDRAMSMWGTTGAISGMIAVIAGAFGAHALRDRVEPRLLEAFETAARYQMFHALALIVAAWRAGRGAYGAGSLAGWCFLAGTVLFCGSLDALAITGVRAFGIVTPLGGLAFIAGWGALAASFRAPRP
jgi:uncharacterized membrane protein YgdD (TMEM256/DUF423 family)